MERRARLTLWRLSPPFRRTVSVRRISIGGFLELVRVAAPKAAAALVASREPLHDTALIRACANADTVAAFGDLVIEGQPVGFLRGWLDGRLGGAFARRNTAALLAACRLVEGDGQWTRFLGCLNRGTETTGARPRKKQGGGLMADVLTISGMMGVDPIIVLGWPMQAFLNLCDSLNVVARQQESADPLTDPDSEPSDFVIPGLFQVH